MKFSATLISLALAICVTSTPTPLKRDIASIQAAIGDISTAVVALDDLELAYTGGDYSGLQAGNAAVVAATNTGTDVANASDNLSEIDSLGLVGPIQTLTTQVQSAVQHIIDIQQPITDAGGATDTLNDLITQKASATAFATAVTAKVPDSLKDLAAQLAAGITDAIQEGIDAYTP